MNYRQLPNRIGEKKSKMSETREHAIELGFEISSHANVSVFDWNDIVLVSC